MQRRVWHAIVWLGVVAISACAVRHRARLHWRHGAPAVRERQVATLAQGTVDYWTQVRPIFEARCVVCHGCYDAPCQVKLGSPEGIDRGASKDKVYDSLRVRRAPTTRLFEDAQTTQGWREKEFHPIVNEREQTLVANREAGLMLQLLDLKREHPFVPGQRLPDTVDLTLQRDNECPTTEELPHHMRKHPEWGMPYGLPGLTEQEYGTMRRWLEEGALHTPEAPLSASLLEEVVRWEALLNGDSLKERLASRYIYEHLFLAHLYFGHEAGTPPPQFFELVRSKTPPGQPVDRIATRRPYDSPGVQRPYYRIVPVRESVVAKLHMPYRLDAARMERWRSLLLDADYEVKALPLYTPEVASNPFISFRAIPVSSRYQFMLDEAEFTIMGFIKGAVCRGPIALNVIDDHFWIFFIDPSVNSQLHDADFLFRNADALRMPAASGSTAPPMLTWVRLAVRQRAYAQAKANVIRSEFSGGRGVNMEYLWDGEGHNPNAALTVFRHFDSASVVRGMVGGPPKTAWVLGYPLLERIHYLLVAGFDVFGNVGHQLATRTYMDFLRMEAEFAFLAFLPKPTRASERKFWYRNTNQYIHREIVGQVSDIGLNTEIRYGTDHPKLEFYEMLRARYGAVDERTYAMNIGPDDANLSALARLASVSGLAASLLPQVGFLLVTDPVEGDSAYTLIHNNAHLNISSPLAESNRRARGEDTLTVTRSFVGTYPNVLFVVPPQRLPEFADQVEALGSKADYLALLAEFGIRRTDPRFWGISDRIHAVARETYPIESGLFDLSRVEDP